MAVTERAYDHFDHDSTRRPFDQDIPSRPDPGRFHEEIENQFDFDTDPLNPMNYYQNEVSDEVPEYIPKTTYKYENDYKKELPIRPETIPDPTMMSYTTSTLSAYSDEPNYYEYDPMYFVKPSNLEPVAKFPDLQPFDETDYEISTAREPNFAISDRRAMGRSLNLAPEFGPTTGPDTPNVFDNFGLEFGPTGINLQEENHQFTHVDAPDTFRSGHLRGNYIHHKRDIEEHEGPHHLQEVGIFL